MVIRLPALRLALVALMVLPVFFNVSPSHVGLGASARAVLRSSTSGVDLGIGFMLFAPLVSLAVFLGFIKLEVPRANIRFFGLAGFVGINIIAFVVGASAQPSSTITTLGYLAQTLLPTTAFVLARALRSRAAAELRSILDLIVLFCLAIAVLVLLQTAVEGIDPKTGISGKFGPLNNSKALRFFPTMMAVALITSYARMRSFKRFNPVLAAACIATGTVLLLSHSRTSLAAGISGIAVFSLLIERRSKVVLGGSAATLIFAILLSTGLLTQNDSVGSKTTAVERFLADDAEIAEGDALRWEAIRDSAEITFTRPLGRHYAADLTRSTAGQKVAVARIAISENQLGEYGVRAGPIAVISFLMLAFDSIRGQLRRVQDANRSDDRTVACFEAGIFAVLTTAVLGGSLLQLNFTESYFAIAAWFFLGLGGMCAAPQR